jgi:hypothetical protein
MPLASGRDKDGYVRIIAELSDTAQVANDCVIVITDGLGHTLDTITIPVLTGTPTEYTIRHKLIDPRDRCDWQIKKSTATTNSITVTRVKQVSPSGWNSSIEANSGWFFTGTRGLRIFDCSVEGIGSDALQCSDPGNDPTALARDVHIRGFLSRCCSRQGVSFNGVENLRFEDFDVMYSGRSAIDIEPETVSNYCDDVSITRGRIYAPINSGIACGAWHWIDHMNISDVEFYDCGRAAIEGGTTGGTFRNLTSKRINKIETSGAGGAFWYDFIINGNDVKLYNCDADRGFAFRYGVDVDRNGAPIRSGGYILDGFSVKRESTYGAVSVMAGAEVSVSNGPRGTQNPVPTYGRSSVFQAVGPAGGVRRASALDVENSADRLPASYGGGIIHTHLWSPGGHDFVNEPLMRAASISGSTGTAVTLQASTPRTATGTTTAVDVGEATTARFRLLVTAASGTLPTLDVAIQQSHDNTTFATIDTYQRVEAASTGQEFSKLIEFRNTARYLRLSYTIGGTSPSFTFSVIGDVTVAGNNLRAMPVAVSAAATTHAVTFPSRTYANPTSFTISGTTGGSLSTSTTYYYRVGGRPLLGGPIIPLAEKTVTTSVTQTAVTVNVLGMSQLTAGLQVAGLTIWRGTSTGAYTARYDVLPQMQLYTSAINNGQNITDLGATATFGNITTVNSMLATQGYPASIPAKTGSFTLVDETGYELDNNYMLHCETNWATHVWITNKARTGFTINFGTAAPGDGSGRIAWMLIR